MKPIILDEKKKEVKVSSNSPDQSPQREQKVKIAYPQFDPLKKMLNHNLPYPEASLDYIQEPLRLFNPGPPTYTQLIEEAVKAFRKSYKQGYTTMIPAMSGLKAFMFSPVYKTYYNYPVKIQPCIAENSLLKSISYREVGTNKLVVTQRSTNVKSENKSLPDYTPPLFSEFRSMQQEGIVKHIDLLLTLFALLQEWQTETVAQINEYKRLAQKFYSHALVYNSYLTSSSRFTKALEKLEEEKSLPSLFATCDRLGALLGRAGEAHEDRIINLSEIRGTVIFNRESIAKLIEDVNEYLAIPEATDAILQSAELAPEEYRKYILMLKNFYTKVCCYIERFEQTNPEFLQLENIKLQSHRAKSRLVSTDDDKNRLDYLQKISKKRIQNLELYLIKAHSLITGSGFDKTAELKVQKVEKYKKEESDQKAILATDDKDLISLYNEDNQALQALVKSVEEIFSPLQDLMNFIGDPTELDRIDELLKVELEKAKKENYAPKIPQPEAKLLTGILKYLCNPIFRPYLADLLDGGVYNESETQVRKFLPNQAMRAKLLKRAQFLVKETKYQGSPKEKLVAFFNENYHYALKQNTKLADLANEVNEVIFASAIFLYDEIFIMKDFFLKSSEDADFFNLVSAPFKEKEYLNYLKHFSPSVFSCVPVQILSSGFSSHATLKTFTLDWLDDAVAKSRDKGYVNPYLSAITALNRAEWELGVSLSQLWEDKLNNPNWNKGDQDSRLQTQSALKGRIQHLMEKQAAFLEHLKQVQSLLQGSRDQMHQLKGELQQMVKQARLKSTAHEKSLTKTIQNLIKDEEIPMDCFTDVEQMRFENIQEYVAGEEILNFNYQLITHKINVQNQLVSWLDNFFKPEHQILQSNQIQIRKKFKTIWQLELQELETSAKKHFNLEGIEARDESFTSGTSGDEQKVQDISNPRKELPLTNPHLDSKAEDPLTTRHQLKSKLLSKQKIVAEKEKLKLRLERHEKDFLDEEIDSGSQAFPPVRSTTDSLLELLEQKKSDDPKEARRYDSIAQTLTETDKILKGDRGELTEKRVGKGEKPLPPSEPRRSSAQPLGLHSNSNGFIRNLSKRVEPVDYTYTPGSRSFSKE